MRYHAERDGRAQSGGDAREGRPDRIYGVNRRIGIGIRGRVVDGDFGTACGPSESPSASSAEGQRSNRQEGGGTRLRDSLNEPAVRLTVELPPAHNA